MRVIIIMIFSLFLTSMAPAQVGSSISADGSAPNENAMLDVKSPASGAGKGILIPRVTENQRTNANASVAGGLLNDSGNLRGGAAQGLIVYQTGGSQGLYFNTSLIAAPAWVYLGTSTTNYLPRTGGTMSGALNMGAQIISDVAHIDFDGNDVSVGLSANGYSSGAALGRSANASFAGTAVGLFANGSSQGTAVGILAKGTNYGATVGQQANGSVGGAAVGSQANGSITGVAVGASANGYYFGTAAGSEAKGTNYGAAVGYNANGSSAGAAVGYLANGYSYGAAMGPYANGYNDGAAVGNFTDGYNNGAAVGNFADGTNFGAALGRQANGSDSGAAVGYLANGDNYGAAVGRIANGYVSGVAMGASANGYSTGTALGNLAKGTNYGAAVGNVANGSDYGAAVGREANAYYFGAAVGYLANGYSYGAAMGPYANGTNYGVAVGYRANGARTNVAIGAYANARGGTNHIAIGYNVTNNLGNDTAVIRGTLYLDGGTGVNYRTSFGSGNWSNKAFEINHPLDPENKILRHYCLEGPQVWNVYAGNAQLVNGQAQVQLPDYYSALNLVGSEIYSLTPIGGRTPTWVQIKGEVKNNRFVIEGSSDMKVSWTIKVLRNDPGCLEDLRRRPVEQMKR